MPHITLPDHLPGIIGPLETYPRTGKILRALAQELLRGESSLATGERELIATVVSARNDCEFCQFSHGYTAKHLLEVDEEFIETVKKDHEQAPVSDKMKALLDIAASVQKGGLNVTDEQVERAKSEGADDQAIHDTVLIAAAFCMFNRYVDGLDTRVPEKKAMYEQHAVELAEKGYVR